MAESSTWHLVRLEDAAPFVVEGDVIVGRSKQADLRIEEGYVSRRHARLWLDEGRLMVEDLGSANGTFKNGERLTRRSALDPGDRICFDESEFYIELPAGRDARPDPNATAHRPDDDPEFPKPERPVDWDPQGTVELVEDDAPAVARAPEPPPFAPEPPRAKKAPTSPTETDFDLGDADFELDGPSAAPSTPSPAPSPAPAPVGVSPPRAAETIESGDFDLGLTSDAPLDLSIGSARPDAPARTEVVGAAAAPEAPSTVAMTPEEAANVGGGAALRAPQTRGDAAGLLVLSGPDEGMLFALADGRLGVGRAPECDIRIEESSVSKRHAEILVQPGNCRIHDTSRSNGVFVNGDRVEDHVLNPGDVIRLGRIEMMFDAYEKLAAQGADEEGTPWLWLVAGFVGTGALAALAWLGLQVL